MRRSKSYRFVPYLTILRERRERGGFHQYGMKYLSAPGARATQVLGRRTRSRLGKAALPLPHVILMPSQEPTRPPMFRSFDELLDAARARGPISIAVAAAHDPDVIEALKRARELKLAEGILVGKGNEIRAMAREGGFELSESQIVNEADPAAATRQAISLVREGRAGMLRKGKIATASLIRAVLD